MAMSAAEANLNAVLPEWALLLQEWSSSGRLTAAAQEALMLDGEHQVFNDLVDQWAEGDFSSLPPIVLLSAADMNGAIGAYAASTGKIYLNSDWLVRAPKEQILSVLNEELGHSLDAKLNATDTPGDEGEYFSRLLSGEKLSESEKVALRTQSDAGVVLAGGDTLVAENASPILPGTKLLGNSLYKPLALSNENWFAAENKAVAMGGHIASINNLDEQNFIANEYGVYYSDVYLGNQDLASDGIDNIYKNADGTPQTYSNWLPGYPELRPSTGSVAVLISRTYFNPWESGWFTNGWYSGSPQEVFTSSTIDPNSGEYTSGLISEIPITSSIVFSGTPQEGQTLTTTINLNAGTQGTGNLVNGATVYYNVTGITADDLTSTSPNGMSGSGTIHNGQLVLNHALKIDSDTGEQFEVSVYSDSALTQQIGTTSGPSRRFASKVAAASPGLSPLWRSS